jgi:hypothetical protein
LKINEKIAETIYTPLSNGPFLAFSDRVQQLYSISLQRKIAEIS